MFLAELGWVVLALAMAGGAVFTAVFFDVAWLQIAAFVILLAVVVYLLIRSFFALWRREFAAFFLRFLGGVLLLPAGALGLAVIAMAGKFSVMLEGDAGTLPVPAGALRSLEEAGGVLAKEFSAASGSDWSLEVDAVSLEFGGRRRFVEFGFTTPRDAGRDFRASVDFAWNAAGGWEIVGGGSSGDTETFAVNQAAYLEARKAIQPPQMRWPLDEKTEQEFTRAASELAAALTARQVLDLGATPWELTGVRFSHYFSGDSGDRMELRFQAKDDEGNGAHLFTYWTYDGKVARLGDVSAGINNGARSSSTREQSEEVRTEINEILTMSGELLQPEKQSQRGWESCTTTLPDGSKLTYSQQPAHPFLAEYHMRATIERPDGTARVFSLPMNTGGRTAVFVHTGITAGGDPAIRLSAGRHFDTGFELTKPRFIAADQVLEPELLGAFLQISTPLQWVSADSPESAPLLAEAMSYVGGESPGANPPAATGGDKKADNDAGAR